MNYIDYLKELKRKLIPAFVFLIISIIIFLLFSGDILNYILVYGKTIANISYVYLYPQEVFIQQLSIAFLLAIITTIPIFVCCFLWFIADGLYKKELIIMIISCISMIALFGCGIIFAIKILLPFCLKYFMEFNNNFDISGCVSVEKYLSLFKSIILPLGFIFEMPIISVVFTFLGLLKSSFLKKGRRVVIILALIIGAIITPPDVVSQIMVTIPMVLLYEICIILNILIEKLRKKGIK